MGHALRRGFWNCAGTQNESSAIAAMAMPTNSLPPAITIL
jgi:hypothetical protein